MSSIREPEPCIGQAVAPSEQEVELKDSLKAQRAKSLRSLMHGFSSQIAELRRFLQDSGVYALMSILTPLISLGLVPFLTHTLSPSDYGILTILSTSISLLAGITQLGLGSAFFHAYSYGYTLKSDKRSVIVTTAALLFIVSLLIMLCVLVTAPLLAERFFGRASLGELIITACGVVCLQNLALPGSSFLRAESRRFTYSLLSLGNTLITLCATLVLVGALHWGIEGALLATGIGYTCFVFCTILVIFGGSIHIRLDIAQNLLGFGVPLILSFISYWVLQLSDRYLLSFFGSLAETAKYAVAYSLGSAMATVVIGPFTLAWPTTMFTIAKSEDAPHTFQLVFRWLSLFMLLASFGLSFLGVLLLNLLFATTYHVMAPVIPIVSASMVFYGIYFIFMIGANIKRKVWISGVFTTLAAVVNFLLNLVLIPLYGALGAAVATLIAYIVLALAAYIVNQRIYPIAFEVGRFASALLLGIVLYTESMLLAQGRGIYVASGIYSSAFVLYACCLVALCLLPTKKDKPVASTYFSGGNTAMNMLSQSDNLSVDESTPKSASQFAARKVCMHLRSSVRKDVRARRAAVALVEHGFEVFIVDVEHERLHPTEEDIVGIRTHHLFPLQSFIHTRFKFRMFMASIYQLLRTEADIYQAHEISALPACYIAARLRGKPFIFDAYELPLSNLPAHWQHFRWLMQKSLTYLLPRSAGVITVSPYIAAYIRTHYHVPEVALIRNFPPHRIVTKSDRLRESLGLGPEVRIALYQGNLQPDRSLEILVYAAKFLKPDTVIVMMGWASDEVQKQLEALIVYEEVADRVKILPPVPYVDLLDWTSSADLGLVILSPDYSLSIRWCLPNKLFEYIMAGLPVLAAPLDAVEDVLKEYGVGQVVPSLAPTEIAAAIEALLADHAALAQMRCNAFKAAQQDLCWEQEQRQLVLLYKNILERGTRKA
jgi:O-antigen/teichoic acid export membrane protein/glycosyltransferase involved in cell wall biosynthesis